MLQDIVQKPVEMKEYFSPEAKSLLSQLLERNPTKRLGNNNDAHDIMAHPFFRDINWDDLRKKLIKPPYKPFTSGPEDCRNIDLMFTQEKVQETPDTNMALADKKKTQF
jgi:serine/threonine protein kinase